MKTLVMWFFLFAMTFLHGVARAELLGVIENALVLSDSVTGLMWTQDANLARTLTFGVSGIGYDGRMTYQTARLWVEAMNQANYGGYNDWRLPVINPVNGINFNYSVSWSVGAETDMGPVSSPASELGYMYYQNLGGIAPYDLNGNVRPDHGIFHNGVDGYRTSGDIGVVSNLIASAYWTSSTYPRYSDHMLAYSYSSGMQGGLQEDREFYVWAVRPVPTSGTMSLLLVGLAMAQRFRLRKESSQ